LAAGGFDSGAAVFLNADDDSATDTSIARLTEAAHPGSTYDHGKYLNALQLGEQLNRLRSFN